MVATTAVITAGMVARLRASTSAPMMECKKALTETGGDMARAEALLRVKLGNKASKAAGRITAEGTVAAYVCGEVGALVEINCETDFVAKNDRFLAFARQLAECVARHNPENAAALSALAMDDTTVEEVRTALIGQLGENLTVRRFVRYESRGMQVASYVHGERMGVLVQHEGGDAQLGKDIAMHIAAMQPVALSASEVPDMLLDRERAVAEQKARESGKPADIAEKMIQGSINKYLKEVSLLDQPFVKNDKQTIAQLLKASNASVKAFTLYIAGEGIEKRQDDFAGEVAAQVAAAG